MPDTYSESGLLLLRAFYLVFFLTIVWAFGFAGFVVSIRGIEQTESRADGIVVLTGGVGRIDEGFRILIAGRGNRLLISGVDQNINNKTILAVFGQDQALWDCCVDAGRQATNTMTNALEAAAWANNKGYASLILITSDYHMPRSLNVFQNYADNLTIIPHPVKAEVSPLALSLEYDKYLLSLVRIDLKN
jgi:uncharacterized SAM-binding protein YcdF (DUF218 family)